MERRKVVIIGGGAGGLMLSSLLPESLLVERGDRVGRKLLISGGGKCNITHSLSPRETVEHYYEKKKFVSPSIYSFPPSSIVSYFSSRGLETYVRDDGKVFPVTDKSQSVVDAFLSKCGEIWTDTKVERIEKTEDFFILYTTKGTVEAERVVFSTGGASVPLTGSDGSAFSLLSHLGHSIVPLSPALSQIVLEEDVSLLEGLTIEDAAVKIGKQKGEGSLLFTRKGISGPMVQNLSRFVSGDTPIEITLSSLPPEEIRNASPSAKAIKSVHDRTKLPLRLLQNTLNWGEKNIGDLSKKDITEYRDRIFSWRTTGTTKGQMNSAMVTKGGVDTKEVDSTSLKSKVVDNLWIIGEALDVDGECGGYNLSFAFASAYCAAASIRKEMDS